MRMPAVLFLAFHGKMDTRQRIQGGKLLAIPTQQNNRQGGAV
jgi:hypothetical protein